MPSLDQLRIGQRGLVEGLAGNDVLTQRLMEMGVLEGEEITVVSIAPLGDPLEFLLRDYRLSLRRAEAARVRVALLP
jgi:ferrous iron transport protein A